MTGDPNPYPIIPRLKQRKGFIACGEPHPSLGYPCVEEKGHKTDHIARLTRIKKQGAVAVVEKWPQDDGE